MTQEIEEKFVSDDGVSSVDDPITAAGGPIKDKIADKKIKVDPKADKVDDAPVKESKDIEDEDEDEVNESVSELFEGMDLSEEFKSKISLVFEAAVHEAAEARAKEITESLEESFVAELNESVDEVMGDMIENLDNYLDYVVSEWMTENEIAIESGIRVEMAESFMDGLKGLFYDHNVRIDEETIDIVGELEEEIATLKAQTNKTINENIELEEMIAQLNADKVFEELSEGLTETQSERLRVLSEKLDYSNLDSFRSDLSTLKESFFKKKTPIVESRDDETEILTEDTSKNARVSEYDSINAIANFLNSRD